MKFCQKCGKEIMDEAVVCPGCGCAIEKEVKATINSYDDCVKGAANTNIIACIILAIGVVCALFLNVWLGVVLCLVSELVALSPNSKLQKAFKNNNKTLEKKSFNQKAKECQKELKAKYSSFKFSFILGYIALACLIIFVFLGNALGL